MQQPARPIPHNRHRLTPFAPGGFLIIALVTVLSQVGCEPAPPPPEAARPFAGQKLVLHCPDAAFADAISPMVKAWEVRTGCAVTIAREIMTPAADSDIAVIPTGALGEWGDASLLAPVPVKLRAGDHPYQWFGLLPAYGERLVEWGGQTLAVPLTGDGFVVVYRVDRLGEKTAAAEFQSRYGRPIAAPVTWEEFADLAVFFAERDKKPSLPPLPADPERLFDLFSRVASSADRRAMTDAEVASRAGRDPDALAFHFTIPTDRNATSRPRLTTGHGFRQAGAWLARLHASRAIAAVPPGGSDDPVAALAEDRAVMALLSLDQLARLPREGGAVAPRFALAGVPGTRTYFNADAGKTVMAPNPNYVPYFSGGRLGVVRARCQHQEAAFDLLADLGGPARSAEFVATPGLGAGPVRSSQLDSDRLVLWLSYGFDAVRSRALQDAMRHYVGPTVRNPTFGLRGPERAPLVQAAAGPLRKLGAGAEPAAALTEAEAAWLKLDAQVPPEKLSRWRRHAAGLN